MTKLSSAGLAVALAACSASSYGDPAPSAAAPAAADFRYQKTLDAETRLAIYDQNGPITVEAASGDTLEVVGIKTGDAADLARVQIVAREDPAAHTIAVCALWPGQTPDDCRADHAPSGHTEEAHDVRVRVELRVRMPARVTSLVAKTMNGDIDARTPATGPVRLTTMNGAISVTSRGPIAAETMNGAVVAHASAGSPVDVSTKNGRVELVLPPDAAADIDASTSNGRITSDVGTVPPPSIPPLHAVRFRVGAGGVPISVRTLNGSIAIAIHHGA